MRISARNVLKGTIVDVKNGAVSGHVTIKVGDVKLTSSITMEAISDLHLEVGTLAYAIIKANHVLFAVGDAFSTKLSARNQLTGTITTIRAGAVNGSVSLELPDGAIVTGSLSNAAIKDLDLEVGKTATAIIKSTDVMIGIDD